MIESKDLYWLSGLLEGEGCFRAQEHGQPIIVLAMSDEDVVARAAGPHGRAFQSH